MDAWILEAKPCLGALARSEVLVTRDHSNYISSYIYSIRSPQIWKEALKDYLGRHRRDLSLELPGFHRAFDVIILDGKSPLLIIQANENGVGLLNEFSISNRKVPVRASARLVGIGGMDTSKLVPEVRKALRAEAKQQAEDSEISASSDETSASKRRSAPWDVSSKGTRQANRADDRGPLSDEGRSNGRSSTDDGYDRSGGGSDVSP